jgi:RecA/RadA recombinase
MTRSPLHSAALEYALKYGWHVFPCVPGGKTPLTQHGYKEATIDPSQIDAWWNACPNANVAAAMAPSNLVTLDVDVGRKTDGTWKQGRKSLLEIEHELTATLLAATGGVGEDGQPGMHAVYARPPDVPPVRIIGFREGLDLIGDGYIVLAPSFNASTGRYYSWTQLHAIAPLPPYLQHVTRTPKAQGTVTELGTAIVEGGRNNALFKLGCALRDTGIGPEALARALDAENKARFKPPLEDAELGVIVNSIIQRVQVTRDIAANAVVEQQIQQIFAPQHRSELLENVARAPQPPMVFYSTGFEELDKLLSGGFATRQLCGIIGPPSTGKSALVGDWLVTLSKHRPVLHCSLELMRHELFVRYAAHEMEFPWVDGVKGRVDQGSMAAAVKGLDIRLIGAEDVDSVDPLGTIIAEAARIKALCGIAPVIAIDYIQLMARGQLTEMRHRVGELTSRCRRAAQELDTVVLGVFTTQRQSYSNKKSEEQMRAANDPTAYLGAAKESGDIEFDCATLMYLDVDKLAEGPNKPARIAVARCRVGDIGFVGVRAKLDIGKFCGDPTALAEFASEARASMRDEASMEAACALLLTALAEMPGRPWRDVQARVSSNKGVKRTLVDRARDKLIADKVIEKRTFYDENHKAIRGDTFAVRNSSPPPNV